MIDSRLYTELKADKLILKKLNLEDRNEIFAIRSNKEIAKYLDRPSCKSLDEADSFILKINSGIEKGEWFYWGICVEPNKKIIGTICLWNISDDGLNVEIGFELFPEYQGKGFMSKAIKLVLNFAFNVAKFEIINGETVAENSKSINIMKKFGFVRNQNSSDQQKSKWINYFLKNPNK